MDPLDELKSLLNIPEGMTAGEAKARFQNAHFAWATAEPTSIDELTLAELREVWHAIAYVIRRREHA